VSASQQKFREVPLSAVAVSMAALAGIGAGLLGIAFGAASAATLAFGLAIFAVVAGSWALAVCRSSLIHHARLAYVGTIVFAGGLPIAVVIPGLQLSQGWRESKLATLGFEQSDVAGDVALAYGLMLLAFVAYGSGEVLVGALRRDEAAVSRAENDSRHVWFDPRATYLVLVGFAIVAFVLAPAETREEAFASRGQVTGQGPLQLLSNSWAAAVAVGITYRHWGARPLAAVSVALASYGTLIGGTRTPFILIGAALLLRFLRRSASGPTTVRVGLVAVAVAYAALVSVVAISDWRGHVARGDDASIISSIEDSATNPFARLSRGGLDTLDGLILATKVDRDAVGASWTDPSKAVTTFVPRQFWPDKPSFLSSEVTQYYTNFGGNAGMFLSGPGYGIVAFGGVLGMAAFLVLLGALMACAFNRFPPASIPAVLCTYFLTRFFFAGDAFDAFHALGIGLLVLCAGVLAHAANLLIGSRQPPAERLLS
jgi:hypothetical protein